jgi:acyl-CoA reductase-like NAD-dependent aldehyde dehydrogenase
MTPAVDTRTELQLIGGERVPAADGRTIDVLDPATGTVIGTVPRGGAEGVEAAVDAAEAAFPAWRDTSATARGAVIARWAARVREHEGELVLGGGVPDGLADGFFVEPTLFDRVDPGMRVKTVSFRG